MTKNEAAKILVGLHQKSPLLGMGFLDPNSNRILTVKEAEQLLGEDGKYFDYLWGRLVKTDFRNYKVKELDSINFCLYDRDVGPGLGYMRALDALTDPKLD